MSWNEPGNNPNQRDPHRRNSQPEGEPPDLDEMLQKLKQSLLRLFGGGRRSNGGTSGSDTNGSLAIFGLIGVGLLILWALSGIFVVGAAENAVILRFGKYTETLGPGIHWVPRIIEAAYKVNTQEIAEFPYRSEMLTKDENIVDVALVVQYRVNNPEDFLLKVNNPRQSLQEATASALRQVIGNETLDAVLTSGRAQIREDVYKQLGELMKSYQTGLEVTDVTLQPAKPPEAVTAAFDDAIKAREDEQRFINKAQAYTNRVEPVAQGQAQRLLQEANAYKSQIVLAAKGNTAGYLAVLPEYKRAPEVTRERLYLDAIQSVLDHSTKVLVDVHGSNNMLYLPLDKIMQQSATSRTLQDNAALATNTLLSQVEQQTNQLSSHSVPVNTVNNTSRSSRPTRRYNPDSYVGTGDRR